jgi:cation:H+ antiporter
MILLLLAGFGALYFGADWMVRGAARLQGSLGLSPIVIGLTVVSLGTSAPELFVAILATLRGSSDIAVGNVLGSNLANIGLILGATALVQPLIVVDRVVKRDIPIMILLTLLLYPFIIDGVVSRSDGMILTAALALYLLYIFQRGKKVPAPLLTEYSRLADPAKAHGGKALVMDVGLLVAGAAGLLLGGRAIVESATYLAMAFGISELTIGLTVVALGTSLPELATSILAAVRKQTDIAVGNVIGSNIFNITGVVGITGTISEIDVDPGVLWVEFPAVILLSLLALLVPFFPLAKGKYRIRRWEGAILLGAYFGLFLWILGVPKLHL